jgi:transcriptional regulator with XRE-family HTH domain
VTGLVIRQRRAEILWQNYSFMQEVASKLRAFIDATGLTQQQLARAANVSQSTVSRALAGKHIRNGAAKRRLFIYANIADSEASRQVQLAFEAIWDGTDEHAAAIARIIEALSGLQPTRNT